MPSDTDDDDYQRNRGPTFTSLESSFLIDLVEKYKQIILNPDTKTPSLKAKERAWKLIQKEHNSMFTSDRSADSLKNKWRNLKNIAKKVVTSSMEPQGQEKDKHISRINSITYDSNAHGQDEITDSDESTPKRSRLERFNPEEVKLLLECVRNEKKYILSPATNEEASNQKEQAWARVTEEFNSQNSTPRNLEGLRKKFIKMKHNVIAKNREILKSEPDDDDDDDDDTSLSKMKKNIKKCPDITEGSDSVFTDLRADSGNEHCNSDSSDDSSSKRRHRAGNFTPEESKLLLRCVRDVKDIVLSSSTDNASNVLKHKAWKKITKKFNDQNEWPRSLITLKHRFQNMKAQAKQKIAQKNTPGLNHTDNNDKHIKQEPLAYEDDDDDDDDHMVMDDAEVMNTPQEKSLFPTRTPNIDPLDIVLNGPIINDYNHPEESSEIVKKKLELLKYQMETAELERKRVLRLVTADESEHQLRATEMALRLRTARLEMAAAEAKLPTNHPALVFGPQEALAQTYRQIEKHNHNTS